MILWIRDWSWSHLGVLVLDSQEVTHAAAGSQHVNWVGLSTTASHTCIWKLVPAVGWIILTRRLLHPVPEQHRQSARAEAATTLVFWSELVTRPVQTQVVGILSPPLDVRSGIFFVWALSLSRF